MIRPYVKICCIASVDEAAVALRAGASALGLVSHMPSGPGVIDEPSIARIARSTPPPVATFLLTALQDASAIAAQVARCLVNTVQLVDALPRDELLRLRTLLPTTKIVQVIHVVDAVAFDEAMDVAPVVDAILLDSGNPRLQVKELGGTGRTHDWSLSRRIREAVSVPVFLAGGLHAGNIAAALEEVEPFGVDLCSGVRTAGALDPVKLDAFMAAVRRDIRGAN